MPATGRAVPSPGDRILSAAGYRWVRAAGWGAAVWAGAALASLPVLLADFLGTPLSGASLRAVAGFVLDVAQGRAQLLVAGLAAVVALAARVLLTQAGARVMLVPALAATLPPAFTGHSAEQADHNLAGAGVALHMLGVVGWAGGLAAVPLARSLAGARAHRGGGAVQPPGAGAGCAGRRRGVLAALTRLPAPGQLLESSYGVLLLVEVGALLALVGIGGWHRHIALPALGAGRPAAFLRLAGAVEPSSHVQRPALTTSASAASAAIIGCARWKDQDPT